MGQAPELASTRRMLKWALDRAALAAMYTTKPNGTPIQRMGPGAQRLRRQAMARRNIGR